jgi:hypothetical protein
VGSCSGHRLDSCAGLGARGRRELAWGRDEPEAGAIQRERRTIARRSSGVVTNPRSRRRQPVPALLARVRPVKYIYKAA